MSRFDYVAYTRESQASSEMFKKIMEEVEAKIEGEIPNGRAKSIALTKLEELFMWLGKGIRDRQVATAAPSTVQPETDDAPSDNGDSSEAKA